MARAAQELLDDLGRDDTVTFWKYSDKLQSWPARVRGTMACSYSCQDRRAVRSSLFSFQNFHCASIYIGQIWCHWLERALPPPSRTCSNGRFISRKMVKLSGRLKATLSRTARTR